MFFASSAVKADGEIIIGFHKSPHAEGDIVRMRDLVQIHAGGNASIEELLKMPLGPGPRDGQEQVWQRDDVLKHLELRGVHRNSLRWTGSERTRLSKVRSETGGMATTMTPAFLRERTVQLAEKYAAMAISEHLNLVNNERTDWRIAARIPAEYAGLLQNRRNITGVGGGAPPWLGEQQFVLQVKSGRELVNVPIESTVKLPPMIVAASRPLRRDEILTGEALVYEALPANATDETRFYSNMDDLIGKQLRRSLSTGLPITTELVGDPIVISRGEIVTVECVSGGITVSTQGRSLASGSVGELIEVELPARKRIVATVAGPMKVRVAAVAARTETVR